MVKNGINDNNNFKNNRVVDNKHITLKPNTINNMDNRNQINNWIFKEFKEKKKIVTFRGNHQLRRLNIAFLTTL